MFFQQQTNVMARRNGNEPFTQVSEAPLTQSEREAQFRATTVSNFKFPAD